MNKYTITLELLSDNPPEWLPEVVQQVLEGTELLTYFDYKIEEDKK